MAGDAAHDLDGTEDESDTVVQEHLAELTKRYVVGEVPRSSVRKLSLGEGQALPASNVVNVEDDQMRMFAQALMPPFDPGALTILFERSNALGPNVEAYKTNIESYGHSFEPVIDLDADDADQKIGDAMFLERLHAAGAEEVPQAAYPEPNEIANRRTEIAQMMRLERQRLDTRFAQCVPGSTFQELRCQKRHDEEVTGNAYWEVVRNGKGEVAQFTYAPAYSVRLLPIDVCTTDVRVLAPISAFAYEKTTQRRRFRRFIQQINTSTIFFKEYEDPRVMSARTGAYYPDYESFQDAEPNAPEATELIHFRIFSSRSPYGVPRWVGNMLAVLGSRASEEVNYLYFDNKAVPPLAVLVAGGTLAPGAEEKIRTHIQKNVKGRENFHKILILEAQAANTPGAANSKVTITLQPLGDAQQKDGLFQNYDQNNIDKVGSSFRNPRLLRGDIRDFNKATAEAALEFAEMQVYQPYRATFDTFMNQRVLAPMGVRYHRFVSSGPVVKDPAARTAIVTQLTQANILTPAEARVEASGILGRDIKKLDAEWTEQPTALTLAGMLPDGMSAGDIGSATAATPPTFPSSSTAGAAAPPPKADPPKTLEQRALASVSANLSMLRDRLSGAAKAAHERIAKDERRAFDAENVIEIALTREQMNELVTPEDG